MNRTKPYKYLKAIAILASFMSYNFSTAQHLIESEWMGEMTLEALQIRYGNFFAYSVDLYKLTYRTTSWDGNPDIASGLLVLPQTEFMTLPLIIYMHGTVSVHDSVPSNLPNEAQVPIVYGGVGAISFAPDYLGFGESEGFHPYHHAESESSNAIDMIYAVREFLESGSITDNGQLFISGYSQGGHAAAALHRKLESDPIQDIRITASAFMSGAYSLSGTMLQRILGDDEYLYPAYVMNILLAFNMIYGWYDDLSQIFVHPYDDLAEDLFLEEVNLGSLNNILVDLLSEKPGIIHPKHMIQDSILQRLDNDPEHPIVVAMKANDVFDWAPQTPVMLVYCRNDEQVPFRNAILADSVMNANGAFEVQLFEADPNADHYRCAEPAVVASLLFFNSQLTHMTNSEERVTYPRIYPNPASDHIHIVDGSFESELLLFNMGGQVVWKETHLTESVILELDLPEGMYNVIIRSEEGIYQNKLIIGR